MGCGSSKDLPVEIHEGVVPQSIKPDEETPPPSSDSDTTPDHSSESITSPGLKTKQNGTGNVRVTDDRSLMAEEEEPATRPTSMSDSRKGEAIAFEVIDDSLIRRHPPKKFQKLEDLQMGANLTPEELEMKQETARQRRENIISKRVKSAKERTAKSAHFRSSEEHKEDETGGIESPDDI